MSATVPGNSAERQAPRPLPVDPIPSILLGGSVNLFAGAPGVGKTALMAGLLARLRDGKGIFGRTPNPLPRIVVLSIDRSWHQSSKLWFDLAGFPEIPYYSVQDDDNFVIDRLEFRRQRLAILEDCLKALAPLPLGTLVYVDPLAPFLGGNLLDYDACMVACSRIRRLCRRLGITLIGSAHAGKQRGDTKARYVRPQDRIIGSAAQYGYTDTQMYLAGPEETGDGTYAFLWHPHHAPAEVHKLGRTTTGLFVPWAHTAAAQEDRVVFGAIPTDPTGVGFTELAKAVQLSTATVHRRLRAWLDAGMIERVGRGRYRRKPENG